VCSGAQRAGPTFTIPLALRIRQALTTFRPPPSIELLTLVGWLKEAPMSEGGPDPKPPKDINLLWLMVLGGLFFLFILLAGLIGLTP
jgi:hypothetical protein